jgi:cytochrome c peroxidase
MSPFKEKTEAPKRQILTWTAANKGAFWLSLMLPACGSSSDTDDKTGPAVGFSELQIDRLLRHGGGELTPNDPSNMVGDDEAAAQMGQYLFFDTQLSGSGEFSCDTCHQPENGFADTTAVSEAVGVTDRNTPSILNTVYNRWFYWDGRCDTHWCQALSPLEAPNEHGTNRLAVAHRIQRSDELSEAYALLFDELPDLSDSDRFPLNAMPIEDNEEDPLHRAWSDMTAEDQEAINLIFANIGKSIAAYERKLIRFDSPFDELVRDLEAGDNTGGDSLSTSAKRGAQLFVGEGMCWTCHSGPTFTNKEFHNIALPDSEDIDNDSLGRYDGIQSLNNNMWRSDGAYSDSPDDPSITDKVSFLVLGPEQVGQFKTPSLRNLVHTAPYMHGGHFPTLSDVVDHYNKMDDLPRVGHREELLLPLYWSDEEVADMVALLLTLEGEPLDSTLMEAPVSPLLP